MNREQAIQHIESLYPADSSYFETAKIGQELLEQARLNVQGWRQEPTDVLIEYAHLCIKKEKEEVKNATKNTRPA